MLPGEYEFNTSEKEIMEILAGDLDILLPGANEWRGVRGGGKIEVGANSSFKLRVRALPTTVVPLANNAGSRKQEIEIPPQRRRGRSAASAATKGRKAYHAETRRRGENSGLASYAC